MLQYSSPLIAMILWVLNKTKIPQPEDIRTEVFCLLWGLVLTLSSHCGTRTPTREIKNKMQRGWNWRKSLHPAEVSAVD